MEPRIFNEGKAAEIFQGHYSFNEINHKQTNKKIIIIHQKKKKSIFNTQLQLDNEYLPIWLTTDL